MKIESPYLNAREACEYLRLVDATGEPSLRALYKFRSRHQLRAVRRGKSLLFRRVDLERVLDQEWSTGAKKTA